MSTKSFNEYNLNTSDIPGTDITLEDFDHYEGAYHFSEDYKKQKETLLNSLSGHPKLHLFRYKPYQIAAAFALAFIVLPATCFAASNYYKVHIQKNNYQSELVVSPSTETAADTKDIEFKPVKLVLNYLPAGSEPYPGDTSKYYVPSDEDEAAHGISPVLTKLDTDEEMVFSNLSSLSTTEFTAGENPAYLIKKDSSLSYDKMLYVVFEKEHYLVEAYLGYDITEDEAKKIAENITLEETDAANATTAVSYAASVEEAEKAAAEGSSISEKEKLPSTYYNVGEVLPATDLYSGCEMTVEKVEFFDSVSGFDQSCFSPIGDMDEFVDSSGKVIDHERNEWSHGDGINTLSKVINTETVGRKFVYVTVSVTNSSDKDENDFSAYNDIMFINEASDGKLEIAEEVDNYNNVYWEPMYFDASLTDNTNQHFFHTKIPAGKTVTYHVGYFVDEDLTDNIFFRAFYGENYGAEDSDYSLTDIREK